MRRFIHAFWILPLLIVASWSFSGCDANTTDDTTGRGSLVSHNLLWSKTKTQLSDDFARSLPLSVGIFDVEAYKVVYNTEDANGKATLASGIVLIPKNSGLKSFTMLVDHHGTITRDIDAPSQSAGYQLFNALYATSGYVTVSADYLGFGDSPQAVHPFVHAKSTVNAVVDLMRAAKKLCASLSVKLNGKTFLTGYSQGGYSAMAVHKGIEENYSKEFTITGSTPMAGPHSVSKVMLDLMLSGTAIPNPFFLPYTVQSYNDLYKFGTANDIYASPYNTTIPTMFDRKVSSSTANSQLPSIPLKMLNPTFEQAVRNDPNHPLRKAFQENDLVNWKPKAPIHLYHCAGDKDVPYQNSQMAYDQLKANGATIEFTTPSQTADHGGCFVPAFLGSKGWIDALNEKN